MPAAGAGGAPSYARTQDTSVAATIITMNIQT
jgi:hypothetical protein